MDEWKIEIIDGEVVFKKGAYVFYFKPIEAQHFGTLLSAAGRKATRHSNLSSDIIFTNHRKQVPAPLPRRY